MAYRPVTTLSDLNIVIGRDFEFERLECRARQFANPDYDADHQYAGAMFTLKDEQYDFGMPYTFEASDMDENPLVY